jgi:uncharacterized membrane protein (DUF106 family)
MNIFTSEPFISLVSLVLTALFTYIFKLLRDKNVNNEAINVLQDAIAKVQDSYVEEIKRASSDGKLTKEEAAQARKLAIDTALTQAKGPVKDLLLKWGKDRLEGLVARIVQGKK